MTLYFSTIYEMLTNPQHEQYTRTTYRGNKPYYVLEDRTLYYYHRPYWYEKRNWFENNGFDLDDCDTLYYPIGRILDNGHLVGWLTSGANPTNKLLEMSDISRKLHYPNLIYSEVGKHPYSKHARIDENYTIEHYHKECHRLLLPNPDPKKFFRLANDILP